METYRNPFHPDEDAMLWELHEIRHELYQALRHKTVEEINADAYADDATEAVREAKRLLSTVT